MKKYLFAIHLIGASLVLQAQTASETTGLYTNDSTGLLLNSEAIYQRPAFKNSNLPFSVGGYIGANTYYGGTSGHHTGLSFEMPDFTVFLSSKLNKRTKFLSELAFENSFGEIKLRYAAMDFSFHELLNLRGGLVLNPIGAFNQNHDAPNYEFVDRPLVSTTLLPGILSNVGFGLYGKTGNPDWVLGYEAYLTNGFNDKIIDNELDRTSLAEGVSSMDNFSGTAMFTGKVSVRHKTAGELGFSYMGGNYTKWEAAERKLGVLAVDYNGSFLHDRLNIRGELAKASVDVPETYIQTFGSDQFGAYLDIVGTVVQRPMLGWQNARINLGVRLEYVNYNQGEFVETGETIYDHVYSIMPGISFRPSPKTTFRINYRYQEKTDFLGNAPAKTGSFQVGFASYF